MPISEKEIFDANRELWNRRTDIHLDSSFYNKKGFLKGETVLTKIELNELTGVQDKTMLHLQCHFGLDSLNWARLGATITGIDLSDRAIAEARKLNAELGYDATFICCNLYDLLLKPSPLELACAGLQYDIIFTSYGTIGWLPDLDRWAKVIERYLKPGGIFYMADFHPVVWMFDDRFSKIEYAYSNTSVIVVENAGTYTENAMPLSQKEYGWNHGIGEILNALIQNGLALEFFNEYDFSPYACFQNSIETEKGRWQIKGMEGKIPMVYSLMAKKI